MRKTIFLLPCVICLIWLSGCAMMPGQHDPPDKEDKYVVRTDAASIEIGQILFNVNCKRCHDPYTTNRIVGPGLRGILKNKLLPVSRKPATPITAAEQIRSPYHEMPSIRDLSADDIADIIAFLNTL